MDREALKARLSELRTEFALYARAWRLNKYERLERPVPTAGQTEIANASSEKIASLYREIREIEAKLKAP